MAGDAQAVETLSKREREVAAAYATGDRYKEIARDLGISPTTVRSHLRTVNGKLNVTSKIALAQALADPEASASSGEDAELAADLALELNEAMPRERMMANVLSLISRRDASLEELLDALLDHALEICEADSAPLSNTMESTPSAKCALAASQRASAIGLRSRGSSRLRKPR